MEYYIGLDVSLAKTAISVVDQDGKIGWRGQSSTTPEGIAAAISSFTPVKRIGLETGPLSTWLTLELRQLNLPVHCLEARHAHAALSLQINKTDSNDADGLAQIVRTGWYREVSVKSYSTHRVRALIRIRAGLVDMRRDLSNQIRGLFKTFGVVVGPAGGNRFDKRCLELLDDNQGLADVIVPLLHVRQSIGQQIDGLDIRLAAIARQCKVCQRLMTVPGVGLITALSFMATIEDPFRFRQSRSVGAYLGLTPRRYQSGECDVTGQISKCGDGLMRSYLFEAANVLLTRVKRKCALQDWALKLAQRSGSKKAKVALARKLAVILHQIWISQQPFNWKHESMPA